ncbi:hypothetical protein C7B61_12050 [filamentous cyanobacterium CCP1]|nr:hypothetical protein C7B76_23380 [filamentous cyanobacterium CCP2]PSB64600.1 hypothetical protein C7B61_12050 [filamentous cyanobacterium CCP1]
MNPDQLDQLDRSSNVNGQTCNLSEEFEKLAQFAAQAWKEDHPEAQADSQEDFEACVLYVTTEMATAGKAVGGVTGLALLCGEGSKAARSVCKRVFT